MNDKLAWWDVSSTVSKKSNNEYEHKKTASITRATLEGKILPSFFLNLSMILMPSCANNIIAYCFCEL